MPAFTTIAIAGLAVAAGGAYMQYEAAQDAKDASNRQAQAIEGSAAEQRKQFESQQRIADIKNARERANMARQERMARASVVSAGAKGNVSLSSGVAGGVGSIASQGAYNQGFFGAVSANQEEILSSQSRQGGYQEQAGLAGAAMTSAQASAAQGQAVFSLGSSMFSAGGGWKSIFDGPGVGASPGSNANQVNNMFNGL